MVDGFSITASGDGWTGEWSKNRRRSDGSRQLAHLVDRVFPENVPVRQWVLTFRIVLDGVFVWDADAGPVFQRVSAPTDAEVQEHAVVKGFWATRRVLGCLRISPSGPAASRAPPLGTP